MNIKSTDREDFKLIYDQNYQLIMQVVMHIVYSLDVAEDLTQETFERFYVKNMSFPSEEDAKYWLLRVAKNLALNHVRRNKRELQMVEKVKKVPDSTSNGFDGAKEVMREESRNEVRRAIEMLPENLRVVIQLKEFSGLDYKAIGRVLGISETNVKVRVHRARKKLEEVLVKEEGDVY